MDQAGKVIYLGTFSKSLIPSIRISYMVLPSELLKQYREKLSYYQCTVSRIDQHILTRFMQSGDFERHLNRMRKLYRNKLDKTLDILKKYRDTIEVIGEYSGLHLVLAIRNGMTEEELVKNAWRKASIKIYPLSYYLLDKQEFKGSPKIILGFAGIPEEELETALNLLINSWGLD